MQAEEKRSAALALEKRQNGNGVNGVNGHAASEDDTRVVIMWAGAIIVAICAMSVGMVWVLLKVYGD